MLERKLGGGGKMAVHGSIVREKEQQRFCCARPEDLSVSAPVGLGSAGKPAARSGWSTAVPT